MANKGRSVRVGLFTVVALALAAVVLIVFGGMRFWERSDHYRIVFDDSVMGLEEGAVVYMNGIKVGSVHAIKVAPEDIRKVEVDVKLKRGTPVHADTKAMLQYAGITGLKVIDLRDGTSSTPKLASGAEIAAGKGVLDKLQAQAEKLADQTTDMMKHASDVMQRAGGVMDRVNELTTNMVAITEPAKVAATNLADMSGSLKAMANENRTALRETIVAVRETATGASTLIDGQASQLFANANEVIGEARKLLTANEGPLRAALFDLRQASRSFKELARDVRQRPSRLLFSSTPAERQMP